MEGDRSRDSSCCEKVMRCNMLRGLGLPFATTRPVSKLLDLDHITSETACYPSRPVTAPLFQCANTPVDAFSVQYLLSELSENKLSKKRVPIQHTTHERERRMGITAVAQQCAHQGV